MRHLMIVRFIILLMVLSGIAMVTFQVYHSNPQDTIQKMLSTADIALDSNRPFDVTVHNHDLYRRVLAQGSLGLGQSYMDGWWDCDALDQFFFKLFRADVATKVPLTLNTLFAVLQSKLMNLQSKARAFQVGQQHYDLGDDLFNLMLDKRMIYSCAYWKHAKNLDEAQEHKLNLICKKLYLRPGMKVLDIGCGWGGLALFMAQKYGVNVVGVTISREQAKCAQDICKGLPVEIRLQDYRDVNETFDRIVSVGMFEHVGYKNYQTFIDMSHKLLKDDGLMLLHTIGGNQSNTTGDEWINKYIFTNGMLPSIVQIAKALEGKFVMEDWHNFGADYDKTLMAWHGNFIKTGHRFKQNMGIAFIVCGIIIYYHAPDYLERVAFNSGKSCFLKKGS